MKTSRRAAARFLTVLGVRDAAGPVVTTRTGRQHRVAIALGAVCVLVLATAPAKAAHTINPEADRKAFQAFFFAKFPKVAKSDYGNGPYAINAAMRAQWEQVMEFPPYVFALDDGKTRWAKPFPDGKHYADCFDNKGVGIRQTYPRFDVQTGKVVTLEDAINTCRVEHGDKPLKLSGQKMASLTAVMADSSRGKPFAIVIPDDPRALAAYEHGKEVFYARKGQLGISCASCHVLSAGERLRGDYLAPALGILAAMPIYRAHWGNMGTITRRFTSCSKKTRAEPMKADGAGYRDLDYYLSYMSNGIPITGPGARP
jgi:sulfur-oxidizing protein SoxA